MIDKVVAVIGDEIVLQSDIETQYLQYLSQGYTYKEIDKMSDYGRYFISEITSSRAKLDSIDIQRMR